VVPVLVSDGLGAAARSGTVSLDGIALPVRVAATIAATPAMPAPGTFVVLPAWATPRFPSIPGPNTLLATGTSIDLAAVRAAVQATMPGAQLVSRAQVLRALQRSPAPLAAARVYELGVWVTALLSLICLLFALAMSARSRAQLIEQLTALGITSRQARAVAISEVIPLLSVAVLGTFLAGFVLAVVLGPTLNLAVFTGSASPVPVRPGPGMLLPVAGIVVAAVAIVALQSTAFLRRDVAAALRQEEAG
jgi:putative ABC transport system permease protein